MRVAAAVVCLRSSRRTASKHVCMRACDLLSVSTVAVGEGTNVNTLVEQDLLGAELGDSADATVIWRTSIVLR